MKKIVALILSAFIFVSLSVSTAEEKSIMFHNIPWLSSQETTNEIIADYTDAGFKLSKVSSEDGVYLQKDDVLIAHPMITKSFSDVSLCALLVGSAEKRIAGYYVKSILFTYAYNGFESKLVCVKVDLAGARYDDLATKITKVYGEGQLSVDDEGLQTTIWVGSDNSCVLLYSTDNGETVDLLYGRLDAEEIIQDNAIIQTDDIDPDDVSGL